jgi:hypothetical protein
MAVKSITLQTPDHTKTVVNYGEKGFKEQGPESPYFTAPPHSA